VRAAFLADYRGRHTLPSAESIDRWERLALLRLAAVYALRPPWTDVVSDLLELSQTPTQVNA
jgi:hypothetical protein